MYHRVVRSTVGKGGEDYGAPRPGTTLSLSEKKLPGKGGREISRYQNRKFPVAGGSRTRAGISEGGKEA